MRSFANEVTMRLGAAAALAAVAACSSANIASDAPDPSAASISSGMQRLGASEAKGGCFGGDIAGALDGAHEVEAEGVVANAASRDEMREGVLSASKPVRQAFIRAHLRCTGVK